MFLVKRLVQRTDMRNPDSASRRYTSLAWSAVLGHEEIFEFLLTLGHDDEELSKVRRQMALVIERDSLQLPGRDEALVALHAAEARLQQYLDNAYREENRE